MRQRLRRELAGLGPGVAAAAGEAVLGRLLDWADWSSWSTVVAFATLPGEIETRPILERVLREGRTLGLPRTAPGGGLEFARVPDPDRLVVGPWGVRQPGPEAESLELGEAVLVLVPGLAFDRAGGRLGRGAGYYDRALAGRGGCPDASSSRAGAPVGPRADRRRAFLMGAGFGLQLLERVPMSALDVRLDACVTERELVLAAGPPNVVVGRWREDEER